MLNRTARNRKRQAELYAEWAAAQGVTPTALSPEAFRRCLQPGDLAAVVYPNGTRVAVRVSRLTTYYVWARFAVDVQTARKNGAEYGYSMATGRQFSGAGRAQKPMLVPPTDAERAQFPDGKPADRSPVQPAADRREYGG